MKTCFVIMGFGEKTSLNHMAGIDLDFVYNNIIKPAVNKTEYNIVRADEVPGNSLISRKMFSKLVTADLVIADITCLNANAMYELGIRHALRPYSTIIMKDHLTEYTFDTKEVPYVLYKSEFTSKNIQQAIYDLTKKISELKNEPDSPFLVYMQEIPPITNSIIQLLSTEKDDIETTYYKRIQSINDKINDNDFSGAITLIDDLLIAESGNNELKIKKAFCLYKKDETSVNNLKDALHYMLNNNLDRIYSVTTLCIMGAIYKRLWLQTQADIYLTKALIYYEKAFYINMDFYPGSNVGYLLLEKAKTASPIAMRKELFYHARAIYRSIIDKCQDSYEFDEWAAATLSTAFLVLGDSVTAENYENDITLQASWKMKTHFDQQTRIKEILETLKSAL